MIKTIVKMKNTSFIHLKTLSGFCFQAKSALSHSLIQIEIIFSKKKCTHCCFNSKFPKDDDCVNVFWRLKIQRISLVNFIFAAKKTACCWARLEKNNFTRWDPEQSAEKNDFYERNHNVKNNQEIIAQMLKAVDSNFMICCIKFLSWERNDSPPSSVDTVPRLFPAFWKINWNTEALSTKYFWLIMKIHV